MLKIYLYWDYFTALYEIIVHDFVIQMETRIHMYCTTGMFLKAFHTDEVADEVQSSSLCGKNEEVCLHGDSFECKTFAKETEHMIDNTLNLSIDVVAKDRQFHIYASGLQTSELERPEWIFHSQRRNNSDCCLGIGSSSFRCKFRTDGTSLRFRN
jgi:hypothetical protein